jgi:hypothetical protein
MTTWQDEVFADDQSLRTANITYLGLQSSHPYGISVWRDEVAGGGTEKVEGAVNVTGEQLGTTDNQGS